MTFRSVVTIVPVNLVDKTNDILQALGHGYPNITKPMRTGTSTATNAGAHWYADDALIERLRTLPTPVDGWPTDITEAEVQAVRTAIVIEDSAEPVIVDNEPRMRGEGYQFFDTVAKGRGLEHANPQAWLNTPVMKGDRRDNNGKIVESEEDFNPWPLGVARWREVK